MRALIIDDSKSVLVWMGRVLEDLAGLEVDLCDVPETALQLCDGRQYDLVVVDYLMPGMTGLEVTEALRAREAYKTIPIVMITAERDSELRLQAVLAGVNDFLNKPFDPFEMRARVTNLLSLRRAHVHLADHAERLTEAVARATEAIANREEEVIWRLARAIEMRDGGTGAHISRVASVCRIIAEGLGFDAAFCRMIYLAAPLHDVGKIGIRDAVLGKPGRLTPEEMSEMREHVNLGVRILEDGASELLRIAESIVSGHHEKWDGSGYPRGLKGEAIPIAARIAAVADVFDALCSVRPYKPAWPPEAAYAEIVKGSGSHFDPACVEIFCQRWPEILSIAQAISDVPDDATGLAQNSSAEAADTVKLRGTN
ncbi:HD domain-containing phosphohydrolase [Oryzibacter oryziterrae]|uniref:HD domain-containing phosphohydrolase n=1 Tax=Oryzibacter oryziterrae TaxID=2766474 RepID=UPI001F023361|nr:HD domain-containing phosphohydrolase [Oryzibacter oryziterrae]